MSVDSTTKVLQSVRSRTMRAHGIGLLGANLAIGALSLWLLPVFVDFLTDRSASWPLARLLSPWSPPGSGVTILSLAGLLLAIAALTTGIALMAVGARMIEEEQGK
jgi:hypothetical protein